MNKIRMIISAVAVFTVVVGALAFKSSNLIAFQCVNNVCTFKSQFINPNGNSIHLSQGALTNVNITGQPCPNTCDQPVDYTLE